MSQNFQNLERRKENISAIEPLISAMRTISLSQWRIALNRQASLDAFLVELANANAILSNSTNDIYAQSADPTEILIVLGSNRGLCGNFNKRLLRFAEEEGLGQNPYDRVYLVGKQLVPLFKHFTNRDMVTLDFPDSKAIQNAPALFSLEDENTLKNKSVTLVYNAYQGASRYAPVRQQIYPITGKDGVASATTPVEAILDTDPSVMRDILQYLTFTTHLQACLYSSMASEHSARFALMENADQNVENLIAELEILLQDFRKGKITAETQELAVASGLLNS
jgi:F-type H+-transporting ATPase subunit gamma